MPSFGYISIIISWEALTVGLTELTFTVTEGEAATVCAEILGGRFARDVIVNIDAPPTGGNATGMYVQYLHVHVNVYSYD